MLLGSGGYRSQLVHWLPHSVQPTAVHCRQNRQGSSYTHVQNRHETWQCSGNSWHTADLWTRGVCALLLTCDCCFQRFNRATKLCQQVENSGVLLHIATAVCTSKQQRLYPR